VKVLVLGGYGAVGAYLVTELRQGGTTVVVAGRDQARADRVIDVDEPGLMGYRAALPGIDVVVNASGAENPRLVTLAGEHGCAWVDITATTGYIAALGQLNPRHPLVVDVGLAPGLTNLLAAAVHHDTPGPIDLAVFLGAGERHGAAATDWSYRLLGKRFHDHDHTVRNYTQPKIFTLPGHRRRRLYRLDFSDQHTLTRDLGVPVRTYFGLDSRIATTALAALTWIPGASKAPRGLHLPGTDNWIVLGRGHDGSIRWARGNGQSRVTAILAATAIRATPHLAPGIHHLHHILCLADVPVDRGIELDTTSPKP
jgi:saccharopine dehydrogenase-like NADP-dependent oxidoreductase